MDLQAFVHGTIIKRYTLHECINETSNLVLFLVSPSLKGWLLCVLQKYPYLAEGTHTPTAPHSDKKFTKSNIILPL